MRQHSPIKNCKQCWITSNNNNFPNTGLRKAPTGLKACSLTVYRWIHWCYYWKTILFLQELKHISQNTILVSYWLHNFTRQLQWLISFCHASRAKDNYYSSTTSLFSLLLKISDTEGCVLPGWVNFAQWRLVVVGSQ